MKNRLFLAIIALCGVCAAGCNKEPEEAASPAATTPGSEASPPAGAMNQSANNPGQIPANAPPEVQERIRQGQGK